MHTHFSSLSSTSSPVFAKVLIFYTDIFFSSCFTVHIFSFHEGDVHTYSSRCTHSAHLLPTTRLLALYTSPICGGNYVPPSHPGAAIHTQQNHIHPLSAPASLMSLTVPQCPLSAGLQRHRVAAGADHAHLLSFLSAPHFSDTHIIYFMTEDSI